MASNNSVHQHLLDKAQDEKTFEDDPVAYIIAKQELDQELTPQEKNFIMGCLEHELLYSGGGELGRIDNSQGLLPTNQQKG